MNDVMDAVSSRIKSPYFGYAVLAFFALNWRGIFLLFALKSSPLERLAAFDQETSFWTLVFSPLAIGLAIALITPWLKLGFEWISKKPLERLDTLSLEAENRRLIMQNNLENARAQQFADREKELINRAKRDEEVEEIIDDESKGKLSAEIVELRRERDELFKKVNRKDNKQFPKEVKELLAAAAQHSEGIIIERQNLSEPSIQSGFKRFEHLSQNVFESYQEALKIMVNMDYIARFKPRESDDKDTAYYRLTGLGWTTAQLIL